MDYNKFMHNDFQGHNIDLSTEYYDNNPYNTYEETRVSGRMNPEYYRGNEDHVYGYGTDQLLYGKEKLHDNYGIPYPGYRHEKYAGNKAGFQSMNSVNNNTYLLILLLIFVVITMITVIMNFVFNISTAMRNSKS
jgi:hypothetical protein